MILTQYNMNPSLGMVYNATFKESIEQFFNYYFIQYKNRLHERFTISQSYVSNDYFNANKKYLLVVPQLDNAYSIQGSQYLKTNIKKVAQMAINQASQYFNTLLQDRYQDNLADFVHLFNKQIVHKNKFVKADIAITSLYKTEAIFDTNNYKINLDYARELFKQEVKILQPDYIIFLTGMPTAERFFNKHCATVESKNKIFVDTDYNQANLFIAPVLDSINHDEILEQIGNLID